MFMVSQDFMDVMSLVLSYNPGHNILELCNILKKFGFRCHPFSTYAKFSKKLRFLTPGTQVFLPEIKLLQWRSKLKQKQLVPAQFCLISLLCSKYFVKDCRGLDSIY